MIALALYGGLTTLRGTFLSHDVNIYWLLGQTYGRKKGKERRKKLSTLKYYLYVLLRRESFELINFRWK